MFNSAWQKLLGAIPKVSNPMSLDPRRISKRSRSEVKVKLKDGTYERRSRSTKIPHRPKKNRDPAYLAAVKHTQDPANIWRGHLNAAQRSAGIGMKTRAAAADALHAVRDAAKQEARA